MFYETIISLPILILAVTYRVVVYANRLVFYAKKIGAPDCRHNALKLQPEFPCWTNPRSSSRCTSIQRRLCRQGRNPKSVAHRATVNAGTPAAFLPEDGEPNDLRDLLAVTRSIATIRPILEREQSSYCENKDYPPIGVRHVRATSKRIEKDTNRIKNDSPQRRFEAK